jgi:hypothetical protein
LRRAVTAQVVGIKPALQERHRHRGARSWGLQGRT